MKRCNVCIRGVYHSKQRKEVFGKLEMCLWQKKKEEKVSWIEKVTDEEILRRKNEEIIRSIRKKKSKLDWSHFEKEFSTEVNNRGMFIAGSL